MCVCVCICMLCERQFMSVCVWAHPSLRLTFCVCAHVCVCVCLCVCVGAHPSLRLSVCVHVRGRVHPCLRLSVCVCACVWYLSQKTDSALGVQRQYSFEMMNTSTGLMALRSSRGGGGFDGSQHTYGCVCARVRSCVCL